MSIRDQLEQRTKTRATCRAAADQILGLIMKELDGSEEHLQGQVLAMVISELQVATRKDSHPKSGETTR